MRSGKVHYDYTIYERTNERAYMRSRDLTSQLNAALSSAFKGGGSALIFVGTQF